MKEDINILKLGKNEMQVKFKIAIGKSKNLKGFNKTAMKMAEGD